MNCPICKSNTVSTEVETGLDVEICEEHGMWIPALSYWKWIATQNISYPPVINDGEFESGEMDTKSGKICNDCGQLLRRFAVGHGVSFHVDQCPNCTSIWLDAGEWEMLKKKNLHSAIHFMFSAPWQNKVRKIKEKEQYESLYRNKLGDEFFEEVQSFKKRILSHDDYSLIMTYLRTKAE